MEKIAYVSQKTASDVQIISWPGQVRNGEYRKSTRWEKARNVAKADLVRGAEITNTLYKPSRA